MGKLLIIIGVVLIIAGIIVNYADKIPFLGKMPGDISVERENFKFYFPLTTSIILSVLVSLILYIIQAIKK
jgi:hypothetical protein